MRAKPSLPDTDVFAVERQSEDGATVFLVRHYPSRDAAAASCCTARIDRRAGESDGAALARAARVIDRHHGGSV